MAGMILSGNTLYGTTYDGTVFSISIDGSGFTSFPVGRSGLFAGLVLSSNTLYGTAVHFFGNNENGTVFAINTDGTGFRTLRTLDAGAYGALTLSNDILYGSTGTGVFEVKTDGTEFVLLHNFSPVHNDTNSDGVDPWAGLMLSGNTLYGTAREGGVFGGGTVFKVNVDGKGFTNLHSFSGPPFWSNQSVSNSDGTAPQGGGSRQSPRNKGSEKWI